MSPLHFPAGDGRTCTGQCRSGNGRQTCIWVGNRWRRQFAFSWGMQDSRRHWQFLCAQQDTVSPCHETCSAHCIPLSTHTNNF